MAWCIYRAGAGSEIFPTPNNDPDVAEAAKVASAKLEEPTWCGHWQPWQLVDTYFEEKQHHFSGLFNRNLQTHSAVQLQGHEFPECSVNTPGCLHGGLLLQRKRFRWSRAGLSAFNGMDDQFARSDIHPGIRNRCMPHSEQA